jgi:hypothetical protein
MSSKSPPHIAIVAFVETVNRLGYTADEIAAELESIVRSGADWPRLTRDQWSDVIGAAVIDGKLARDPGGVITLALVKPAVEKVETVKQLSLFE